MYSDPDSVGACNPRIPTHWHWGGGHSRQQGLRDLQHKSVTAPRVLSLALPLASVISGYAMQHSLPSTFCAARTAAKKPGLTAAAPGQQTGAEVDLGDEFDDDAAAFAAGMTAAGPSIAEHVPVRCVACAGGSMLAATFDVHACPASGRVRHCFCLALCFHRLRG